MNQVWLYPFIVSASVQALGLPMNETLLNPWLLNALVVALLSFVFLCLLKPVPTGDKRSAMPWWALLEG